MTRVATSARTQCEAQTTTGRRCRNTAVKDSRYCWLHQETEPGPAKPRKRKVGLVDQAASLGAANPILRHKAWLRVEAMRAGDQHLLAAGITHDGYLVVVTELAIYIARRILFLTSCDRYPHDEIERYEVKGIFDPKLRLHMKRRTKVDVPPVAPETPYPVDTAIVHLWHTRTLEPVLRKILEPHARTLARKRNELLVRDDYGVEDRDAWDREIDRFFTKVVEPSLPARITELDIIYLEESIGMWVDGVVDEWLAGREGVAEDRPLPAATRAKRPKRSPTTG